MYSFAQRPNCEVIDEPFYAAYLKKKDLNHPGKTKTLKLYPNSFGGAIQRVQQFISSSEAKEVYIKNMAQHMVDASWDWAQEAIHIFLDQASPKSDSFLFKSSSRGKSFRYWN